MKKTRSSLKSLISATFTLPPSDEAIFSEMMATPSPASTERIIVSISSTRAATSNSSFSKPSFKAACSKDLRVADPVSRHMKGYWIASVSFIAEGMS